MKKQDWGIILGSKMPEGGDGDVWELTTLKRHAKVLSKTRVGIAG